MCRINYLIGKIGILAAISCASNSAIAQNTNLLSNGGFEAGRFSGYNTSNLNATGIVRSGFAGYMAGSGDYFAALGNVGGAGVFSQTFTTTAGSSLTISFSYASNGSPGYINTLFNSVPVISIIDPSATNGYVTVAANVTATGSDELSVSSQNDPSYFALDDLSVSYSSGSHGGSFGGAPTPEVNAGLGVLLAGATFAFLRHRRGARLAATAA